MNNNFHHRLRGGDGKKHMKIKQKSKFLFSWFFAPLLNNINYPLPNTFTKRKIG